MQSLYMDQTELHNNCLEGNISRNTGDIGENVIFQDRARNHS
jgi:hypothetical protein